MTVVLVVLCLVVGALELYLGRQSKSQADAFVRRVEDLREQMDKQNGVLASVGQRLTGELSKVKGEVLPGLDARLNQNSGQIEQLGGLLRQVDDYIQAQANRLQELEKQRITLAALRRKLTDIEASVRPLAHSAAAAAPDGRVDGALRRISDLERTGNDILELQRDLTRALEGVEDVVTDLLEFTGSELDDAVTASLHGRAAPEVTAVGRLWCRDPELQDGVTEIFEQCVVAHRLTIRLRTSDGAADRLRYFLAGDKMPELSADFAAVLIAIAMEGPREGERRFAGDQSSLQALLRALYETTGAIAQIGPLVVVRTREELLTGVLAQAQALDFENGDEPPWDPVDTAVRLRLLPAHQVWDLTNWAARPPV